MKNLFTVFLVMTVYTSVFGQSKMTQSAEVLNNKTIINLVKAKVPNSVIIGKIENSASNFDLSSDALINLSQNGVAENVINAMMVTKSSGTVNSSGFKNSQTNEKINSIKLKDPGIYYFDPSTKEYQLLDPVIFAQKQTSGGILSSISYGFAKAKGKGNLAGNKANFQINNSSPEFYFYFSKQSSDKSLEKDLFTSAKTPNEFVLIKFNTYPNKNIREMILASANNDGEAAGVDAGQIISFKYEKISDNLYKVKFPTNLPIGEYCFMPTINSQEAGGKTKLFDFGVDY